jgi:hypothetical protein
MLKLLSFSNVQPSSSGMLLMTGCSQLYRLSPLLCNRSFKKLECVARTSLKILPTWSVM